MNNTNTRNHFLNKSTTEQFETARLAVLSGLDIMTDKEKQILAALPEVVTIYRGGQFSKMDLARTGNHWSLSYEIAAHFAKTNVNDKPIFDPIVIHGQIKKSDIVAYLIADLSDEQEIVAKPEHVTIIQQEGLEAQYSSWEDYLEYNPEAIEEAELY